MAMTTLTPQGGPYLGRWWWPDDRDKVVGGRLALEGEIWRLTLFGWLGPWDRTSRTFVPSLLHGQVGSTPLSILDLVPAGWSGENRQPPHETRLGVNVVLAGDHVDAAVRVQRVQLRLHNLNEWANRNPWNETSDPPSEIITFTPPEAKQSVVDGTKIVLDRTWSQRSGLSEVSTESHEVLMLDFDSPQDLEQLQHDWVRPLLSLMELAAGTTSAILGLTIWPHDADDLHRGVTVLSAIHRRSEIPVRNWFQMLFCLADIDFETFLPKFLGLHKKLDVVFDLMTAIKGRGYVSSQFMAAASAVEAYHRRQFEKKKVPKEHKERLARIVSAAPVEDQRWLKEHLAFSHEPTFAERINAVIERAGPLFPCLVGDVPKWRRWVKNGRNSIAHGDPTMLDIDRQWRTTIRITETIRWLLILTLLRDLGLSDETIDVRTRQEGGLEGARANLKEEIPEWFT